MLKKLIQAIYVKIPTDETTKRTARALLLAAVAALWGYLFTKSLAVAAACVISAIELLANREMYKKTGRKYYFVGTAVMTFVVAISVLVLTESMILVAGCTLVHVIVLGSYMKAQRYKEWLFGITFPFVILLITEFLQSNFKHALYVMFVKAPHNDSFGYIIALMLIVFVTFSLVKVANSKKWGYIISTIIFSLLAITNFFVVAFTEQPFTISDIKIAGTAAGVLSSQHLATGEWIRLIIGILCFCALIMGACLIYTKMLPKVKIQKRIGVIALVLLAFLILYFVAGILGGSVLLYAGNLKYGFLGNFYFTLDNGIKIPEDAKDFAFADVDDAGDYRPDVIIIMNEAFSDLGRTFNLGMSEDPLEYFHSLQQNYPSGVAYSSVYGNNTCSSEWEVLSGVPTGLTAKGAEVFMANCKPMRSLVSIFNNRGYNTIGFHPYYGVGYNRSSIWKALGFDQTLFIEDMKPVDDTVRGFVSDEANYTELIKLYEKSREDNDAPVFMFNVTMQNHGGYIEDQYNDVYANDHKNNGEVSTYLSMINKSDDALRHLLSYFSSVDRDAIILVFGDHQPLVDKGFYEKIYNKEKAEFTLEEIKEMYAVPYLIWANYELNSDAAPKETSINYLSNILFDVGNIPKTKWLNMIDDWQKECPIITTVFARDKNGNVIETATALSSDAFVPKDTLLLYQKYSYGVLWGEVKEGSE